MRFGIKIVALLVIVVAVIRYFFTLFSQNDSSFQARSRSDGSQKKIILSWTKFFGIDLDDKYFDNCPELRRNCSIITDKERWKEADAIVFHPRDMNWNDVPPSRTPNQRYLYLMHESPVNTCFDLDFKPHFFNWSFTYRMDSDVPYPYTYLAPVPSERRDLDLNRILNKSSAVVWFVSNCHTHSRRELYVKALQKYLNVDVYGDCGPLKCPKEVDNGYSVTSKCEGMIDRDYKFYIAFENSICKDYVTEKYYGRRTYNSVPIVLSRSVALPLFPPNSFIAVDDFPDGPAQLADYLKYLMRNDTAYLEYFHWKTVGYGWVWRDPKTGIQFGFCGICEKLWLLEQGQPETKSYASPKSWWGVKASCSSDLVEKLIDKEIKADPELARSARKPKFMC